MSLKQLAIAAGVYRPARIIHRALNKRERLNFKAACTLYDRFVAPDDLCFDVGANVGEKTEALLWLGARVVSIEPQPDLAREVRARAEYASDRSHVIQAGISDREGNARLHLKRESTGQASLLADWQGTTSGTIEVPTVTLDSLITTYGRPRFIKIDIEGAEPLALRGLSIPVPYISIEYHCDAKSAAIVRECFSLLHGNVEVNAVGPESADYMLDRWLTSADFLEGFPGNASKHFFGDLIIRQA